MRARRLAGEVGQSLVEYALIGVVASFVLRAVRRDATQVFDDVSRALSPGRGGHGNGRRQAEVVAA